MLRQDYVQREAVTLEALNRAALEGLLKRLGNSAELLHRDNRSPDQDAEPPLVVLLTWGIRSALCVRLHYARPSFPRSMPR